MSEKLWFPLFQFREHSIHHCLAQAHVTWLFSETFRFSQNYAKDCNKYNFLVLNKPSSLNTISSFVPPTTIAGLRSEAKRLGQEVPLEVRPCSVNGFRKPSLWLCCFINSNPLSSGCPFPYQLAGSIHYFWAVLTGWSFNYGAVPAAKTRYFFLQEYHITFLSNRKFFLAIKKLFLHWRSKESRQQWSEGGNWKYQTFLHKDV